MSATQLVDESISISPHQILDELPSSYWYRNSSKSLDSSYQHTHLYGYLNPLRATPIQLVDHETLDWLYRQGEQDLSNSPCFDRARAIAVILCDGMSPSPSLQAVCDRHDIAVIRSALGPAEILDYLQLKISSVMSPRCNRHGVFLAVMNTGVMITGESGIGKSEVALDLVQRGHQLVADDSVEIVRRDGSELLGECPKALRGYIEIRGLGIVNIEKMFGPASVLENYELELIINLRDSTNTEIQKLDRLQPSLESVEILGVEIPRLNMLVAPGRNLAVLVEAATRDHLLRRSGVHSSLEFINRHDQLMGADPITAEKSDGRTETGGQS